MSVAAEIKTALDTLGTLGSIRIGSLPATPNAIGCVREYGGRMPQNQFGVVGIKYEKPSVQIVFRGEPYDYDSPRAKAEIAWRFLAAVQPGTLVGGITVYLTITPQQSPFSLGSDENKRFEIACNFWIEKELS